MNKHKTSAEKQSILCSKVIMIMLERQKAAKTIVQILNQMRNDEIFLGIVNGNEKKGMFKLLKKSMSDVQEILLRFTENLDLPEMRGTQQMIEHGYKLFVYHEYTMFTWISVWLLYKKKITQLELNSADLGILKDIFYNKQQTLLKYEIFFLLSKVSSPQRKKPRWQSKLDEYLKAFVQSYLKNYPIQEQGVNWRLISYQLFAKRGIFRVPNICRERWISHINPQLVKSRWSVQEDIQLLEMIEDLGPKWSIIAKKMSNRSEHMIKNRFNSIKTKFIKVNKIRSAQFESIDLLQELRMKQQNKIKEESTPNSEQFVNQASHSEPSSSHLPIMKPEQLVELKQQQFSNSNSNNNGNIINDYANFNIGEMPGTVMDFFLRDSHSEKLNELIDSHIQIQRFFINSGCKEVVTLKTNDQQWLDNLIEERNLRWLDEE